MKLSGNLRAHYLFIMNLVMLCGFVFSHSNVFGQAVLPVTRTSWSSTPTGWTDFGTGSYTTSFACSGSNMGKLDNTGDYFEVYLDSDPGTLSFSLKKASISGNTFVRVEQSVDGAAWTLIGDYGTSAGATIITDCSTISIVLNSTTRYLRWKYTQANGNCGLDDVTITKTCITPTLQVSNINASTSGFQNLNIQWTNGNGSGRIVYINTVNSFINPVNGTDPTANSYYIGSGQQAVYNGNSNSVNITGLDPCREYWLRAYEYNCSGATITFNISLASGNPASISTSSIPPSSITLASENFEGASTWNYTPSYVSYGSGGSNGSCVLSIKPSPFGYLSSKALVKSHSVNNGTGEKGSEATLDFTQVSIPAGSTNISFSFRLASLSAAGNTTSTNGEGHDNDDSFSLLIQLNSSGTYFPTFSEFGSSDNLYTYVPENLKALNWNQNSSLTTPSNDYSYFTVTIPDGTTSINIRYVIRNNRIGENWCIDEMKLTANTSTTSTLPAQFNITGNNTFCAGSTGTQIGLSGSQTGVNYQLYLNGTAIGTPLAGTGNAINFGYYNTIGTYTIVASNTTYVFCHSDMLNPLIVSLKAAPVINLITTSSANCGANNGNITVNASGGVLPYQYSIDNGATWQGSNIFPNLSAGIYFVKVKDINCESAAISTTISISGSTLSGSVSSKTDVNCYGLATGTATITASGGSGTITYNWNTTPTQTGPTANNLIAGTYICTVSDGPCSIEISVVISQPASALSAGIISSTNVACFGGSTGTAEISANGGTAPYNYTWNTSPVQTGPILSNVPFGTYICTVTDSKSCSFPVTVNILQPAAALSASASALNNVLCYGEFTGSVYVNVTGGTAAYSYFWNTNPPQLTQVATNLPAGIYTCNITDANGCTTSASGTITQPSSALTGNITFQTDTLCIGASTGTATISVNGGTPVYSYSWNTIPVQTTATATNLTAGSYNCTITDVNGCSTVIPIDIAAFPAPTTSFAGNTQTVCGFNTSLNGNVPVIGSGLWSQVSGPSTLVISNSSSCCPAITTTTAGTYIMQWTITNEPACPSSSSIVSITFGNAVTLIAGSNTPLCIGDTILLTSSIPNATYSWTGPAGFVSNLQNPKIYNANLSDTGEYIVNVTNIPNGCPNTSDTTTVVVNNLPATSVINSPNAVGGFQDVCINSLYPYAIDSPTVGSTYNWSLSGGGNITPGNSDQTSINWTTTGNYILTVTETSASGCTGVPVILSITVDSISTPKVTISTPNNTVCEGTQVTFYASPVNGGTNPTYKWFVNGIQQPNTGLSTLTFIPTGGEKVYAVLTSSIPCASPVSVTSVIDTMFVNKLEQPTIDLLTPASSLCSGDTAKIIADLKFEGSSPQYTWYRNGSVIPGENTDSLKFIPNNGDKITAKLTSNYDCVNSNNPISAPLTFTVSNNAPVSLGISQQTTLCNTDLITIQANPTNGGPAPVYEWFLNGILVSGQTTAPFKGMFADGDKIFAKVTSSLTCAAPGSNPATSGQITIIRPTLLQITKVDSTNESCSLKNASITITALGGTPPYKYSINTPADWFDSPLFDTLSAALPFSIQVKDNNGCIVSRGTCQLNNTPGAAIATSGSGVYCEGDSVKLKVTSPAVLSYQWTFPSGYISTLDSIIIASVSINDSGSYKITATQLSTGCQDQTELHIQVNKQPVVDFGLPATLCAGSQQDLTPGPGFASYVWQDGSTNPVYSAVNAGVYYVIATDASGCKGVDSLELVNCAEIYLPTAFSPNINGSNECFHPITGGIVLLDYKMVIYNRWGQLVFESNDYLFGWNGKYQGSEAPAGLYNYFITYKVSDPISVGSEKLIKRRGTVMVVR